MPCLTRRRLYYRCRTSSCHREQSIKLPGKSLQSCHAQHPAGKMLLIACRDIGKTEAVDGLTWACGAAALTVRSKSATGKAAVCEPESHSRKPGCWGAAARRSSRRPSSGRTAGAKWQSDRSTQHPLPALASTSASAASSCRAARGCSRKRTEAARLRSQRRT